MWLVLLLNIFHNYKMSQPTKVECNQLMDRMSLNNDQKIGNNLYWGATTHIKTFQQCFLRHGYRGMMTSQEAEQSSQAQLATEKQLGAARRHRAAVANAWFDNFRRDK